MPERFLERKSATLTALIAAAIVYGSLYPFEFYKHAEDPLRALLSTWRTPGSRIDLLANLLLYLPFGFFALRSWHSRSWPRMVGVFIAGTMLSMAIELAQFYDRGRQMAMSDIYANAAGTLLGAAIGAGFDRDLRLPLLEDLKRRPFPTLLVACWIGSRWCPFVPEIDLHKYWRAVKPLLIAPGLPPADLYRHFAIWLAVALLLEGLIGKARSRFAVLALAVVVFLGRIFIVDAVLTPAEVAGGLLAALAWALVMVRSPRRAAVVAVLFGGAVVVQALEPFQFSSVPRPFGWIPFRSLMQGSMEINVTAFLEKVFTYGALLWLAVRAGSPWKAATGAGAGLVLGLRLCQVYIPGRSAEITDVIMWVVIAVAMRLMEGRETDVATRKEGRTEVRPPIL